MYSHSSPHANTSMISYWKLGGWDSENASDYRELRCIILPWKEVPLITDTTGFVVKILTAGQIHNERSN